MQGKFDFDKEFLNLIKRMLDDSQCLDLIYYLIILGKKKELSKDFIIYLNEMKQLLLEGKKDASKS